MIKRLAKSGQMASSLNHPCTQMDVRQGHQEALSHPASPVWGWSVMQQAL